MLLDTLPHVQSLTRQEKTILAQELLDDLNAPDVAAVQDAAILEVLEARLRSYRENPAAASSWEDARERLREKTGASWRK